MGIRAGRPESRVQVSVSVYAVTIRSGEASYRSARLRLPNGKLYRMRPTRRRRAVPAPCQRDCSSAMLKGSWGLSAAAASRRGTDLMRHRLGLILALALGLVMAAHAADATPPSSEELIEQLGHRDFRIREAAGKALAARGADALAAMRKALAHPDPEVRQRLGQLVTD